MIPNMNPNVVATITTIHLNDDGEYVVGMYDHDAKPVLAFTNDGIPLILGDDNTLQDPEEYIVGKNFVPEDHARVSVNDGATHSTR